MVDLPLPPAQQPRRFGTYTTFREIARGGQGAVLEARSDQSGERVALKVLIHPSVSAKKRFEQEAQVLLRLSHTNLIQVRDQGEKDGFPYLAMEYVDGQDLQDIVDGRGVPEPEWSAEVMAVIADALHYCHGQGIVHRDVKPANVLIERGTRRAVLVDFGLVKRDAEAFRLSALDDDAAGPFSRSGELRGTPCFMSPEQAHPTEFGSVTPATDVYALGATLYYLLTGQAPIEDGPTSTVLFHVVSTRPKDPRKLNPEVPDWLAELCLRCLAKRPEDRPESAAAVAAALRTPVRPPGSTGPGPGWILGALAAGVALGVAIGWPIGWSLTPSAPAPSPAPTITVTPTPAPSTGVAPVATAALSLKDLLTEGRRLMRARKFREAIAVQSQVLAQAKPGSQEVRSALWQRGWSHYLLGMWREGVADYDRAIALSPRNSGLYFDRGRMKAYGKAKVEALLDYDRALELRPTHLEGYLTRGRLRREVKDYPGAIRDFTQAIQLDAGEGRAWAERGWTRLVLTSYAEAVRDYDQSLILEPTAETNRIARGMAHRATGDLERAQWDFDWVIERGKTKVARAYAHRGMVRFLGKDLKGGRADVAKAIELDPRDPVAWCHRGDMQRAEGELKEALESYAKALEFNSAYAAAIAGRGMVRIQQGHTLLAKKDLERALTTMPKWERVYHETTKALEGLQ